MEGESWEVVHEEYQQEQYTPLPTYKHNHLPNSIVINYDLKVKSKVVVFTKSCDFKDKVVLNVVVANLLSCINKDRSLIYPRDKYMTIENKSRKKITVHKVMKCVDFLLDNGYATGSVGSSNVDIEKRISSYIKPTQKFIDLWSDAVKEESGLHYVEQLGVIELRDGNKTVMTYVSDSDIMYLSNVAKELNVLNDKHVVLDRDGNQMTNIYCRIFNESFEKGGRYYRADVLGLQQSRGRNGRNHITIDGENVVEIDYSNLHFRIASELKEIDSKDLPLDIYSGIIPDPDNLIDRQIVKIAVNIMLNSKDSNKARLALQKFINDMSHEDKTKCSLGKSAKDVMELIHKAYPQFDDILCRSDCYGLILQNEDSKLATKIVEVFLKYQKPILIVHDSFIVKVSDMNLLCDTMSSVFKSTYDSYKPVPMTLTWKEEDEIITRSIIV